MNLIELKELRNQYIQHAIDEQIPQKLVKIARLGEKYLSNNHGIYYVFPVSYGDKTAVIVNHPGYGKFINHDKWEHLEKVFVFITDKFAPTKTEKYSELPIFWMGDCAMRWTISDQRTKSLPTDIFVPGNWWTFAQQWLSQAEQEITTSVKDKYEVERKNLEKELLIGKEI